MMKSIEELRKEIDAVDRRIVDDINERMRISGDIGRFKQSQGLPVSDSRREMEKLASVMKMCSPEMEHYFMVLYTLLFELSRSYQNEIIDNKRERFEELKKTIESTPQVFPRSAVVAYQGIDGAYSSMACEKLFAMPDMRGCDTFEDVFDAIDKGECDYGVLPIENSTAGSVTRVYDLLVKYHYYIVRATRVKVNHALVVKPGVEFEDIKEIFSHEQALRQCSRYLSTHCPYVKATEAEDTAMSARMVSESPRNDIAAISSERAAKLYGLRILETNIADNGNNHTRFICVSKKPEIYPGADKTSFMLVAAHKPGSLYRILARFYALGINITKLESRPIPDRDFDFMFYFDLDSSIYSDEFVRLMCDVEDCCEVAQYLGSYSEIP